jgi:DNA invertase Pin-like site-specific DNA recombinase
METYNKSILEYYDVRLIADYAEKEGIKKGRRKGRKEGIEIGKKRGFEIGFKIGFEIGFEIGIKRGAEKERIKFVKSLYANNVSIDIIAKYMDCTEKQIHNILNNDFQFDESL